MPRENNIAIFQTLSKPVSSRAEEEVSEVENWITTLEFFEQFRNEPELRQALSLKRDQISPQEEGVELVYVVSGIVVVDTQITTLDASRRKGKKEGMGPGEWVVRPLPGKDCFLIGKDHHSEVIVINSKRCRKLINKKLARKWAEYARVIARQPLFKYLDKDTMLDIAQTARVRAHPYNSVIYSKGEEAQHSYILLEGNIRVLNEGIQVSFLSPEQIFGDEEILAGKSRRQFKAEVASEKVKLMVVEKSKVEKAFTVLAVLGKEKLVESYVELKNGYRNNITMKMKRLLSDRERDAEEREKSRENLPLYRHKRVSLDQHSLAGQNDPENNSLPFRLMETLKIPQRQNSIRSRDTVSGLNETQQSFQQSVQKGTELKSARHRQRVEQFKLPFLSKN